LRHHLSSNSLCLGFSERQTCPGDPREAIGLLNDCVHKCSTVYRPCARAQNISAAIKLRVRVVDITPGR
jgi:hypothetical protein